MHSSRTLMVLVMMVMVMVMVVMVAHQSKLVQVARLVAASWCIPLGR